MGESCKALIQHKEKGVIIEVIKPDVDAWVSWEEFYEDLTVLSMADNSMAKEIQSW